MPAGAQAARPAPRRRRPCGGGRRCSRSRRQVALALGLVRPARDRAAVASNSVEERRLACERSSTKSRTAGSWPVSGRSVSSQCGLGRNRTSITMSASSGRPCLYPKLSTAICRRGRRPSWSKRGDAACLQLVHVELGGVDDEVGRGFDRLEQRLARARSTRPGRPPRRRAGACAAWCRSASPARRSRHRGTAMRTRWPSARSAATLGSTSTCWRPATSASRSMSLPGLLASSTIVSTSDVGRLSTTYQPRSSSTAAAPERPAPDKPVISTMSATSTDRW